MKKIIVIIADILLSLYLPVMTFAMGTVVKEPTGSITVKVVYDGTALEGMKLTAYRVGDLVESEDGQLEFQRVLVRKSLNTQLKADPKKLADELLMFVKNNSHITFAKQIKAADHNGNITFTDCQPGVYLIVQEENYQKNNVSYEKLNHFLVTVPYNGKYQVDATAKASLDIYDKEQETSPTTPAPNPGTGNKLPQTGQMKWPVPVLSISGMVLFVAGWCLYRQEEKESYET